MIRSWTELKNNGEEDLGVEYVSSFALLGIDKEGLLSTDEKLEVLIARNAWQKELIWNRFSMDQLGMSISQPDKVRRSSQTISVGNTGNWSTKNYLPMGCLKNKEILSCSGRLSRMVPGTGKSVIRMDICICSYPAPQNISLTGGRI